MRTGIALGCNLGDRYANMRRARATILVLPGVEAGSLLAGPIYETRPVDCPPDAGLFLNSALEIEYRHTPRELLDALLAIEAEFGRQRQKGVNASRPLDLDILYAGDMVLATPELTLPHPRLFQRRFVLAPLAGIRPDLMLPGRNETISETLACLADDPAAVALAAEQW